MIITYEPFGSLWAMARCSDKRIWFFNDGKTAPASSWQAGSVLREFRVQDLSPSDVVPPELFFKDSHLEKYQDLDLTTALHVCEWVKFSFTQMAR